MDYLGDYPTREELQAHLDPMRDDIREIKDDVKAMRHNSWLGERGRQVVNGFIPLLVVTLVATTITELISYLT